MRAVATPVAGDVVAIWNRVKADAGERTMGAILSKSELVELRGNHAVVETEPQVRSLAEGRRDAITSLIAGATGVPITIEFRAAEAPVGHDAESAHPSEDELPSADEITGRPLVQEVIRVFDVTKEPRITPRRAAPTENPNT